MEEKKEPEVLVITTHVGLPISAHGRRRNGQGGKRKKPQNKQGTKNKRRRVNEGWQEFLKDTLTIDEGAYNSSIKRAMSSVIKRYRMDVDVEAGLARLEQEVAKHEREKAPNLTGDGSEELLLAVLNLEGIFGADTNRACQLLHASVARGNVNGMFSLGSHLLMIRREQQPLLPLVSPREDESALEFMRKAAEAGHPTARYQLGLIYETAEEMIDVNKAEAYYRAATEAGHPSAPFKLALMYSSGKVKIEDAKEKIMRLHYIAAERRCPEAHLQLASTHISGSAGEINRSMAVYHVKIAAAAGLAEAQFVLADGFEKGTWGDGVEELGQEMLVLYMKSAHQGFSDALNRWGKINWEGEFECDQNDSRAVEFFTQAAKKGNMEAQVYLGWAYKTGRGIKKNSKKAVELLKPHARSAEGHFMAFLLLAEMYEHGEGVKKDTDEASRILELAAFLGMEGAEGALDELHQKGEGLQGMSEQAVEYYHSLLSQFNPGEWLSDTDREAHQVFDKYKMRTGLKQSTIGSAALIEAAEKEGNAAECYAVGWMYENGCFLPTDYASAAKMYLKAAEKENLSALTAIANLYIEGKEDGDGFPMDESKAIAYLTQAADRGHCDAIHQLGICFHQGKGVEVDKEKAKQMWEKAASMGHADAQFDLAISMPPKEPQLILPYLKGAADKGHTEAIGLLGTWYLRGHGVDQNEKKGMELCGLAAKRGHTDSIVSLAIHLLNNSEGDQDNHQAREYLEIGAEAGNTTALLELGQLYRNGSDGIPVDYTKAARYLQEAADGGEHGALIILAFMHTHEQGLPKDEEKFKTLLKRAGEAGEMEGYYHLACWFDRQGDAKTGGQYLLMAAEGGDEVSQRALLGCYASGHGVFPLDEAKSAFWRRQWENLKANSF